MQHFTVATDGSAQYTSIGAAITSASENEAVHIYIRNGVYREKLVCSHQDVTLEGESREAVLLTNADGAKHFDKDGKLLGTFRTQTALFDGEKISVKNMTIANTAGDGRIHGQAIAAAVYSPIASFENVEFLACQDTLFTGPLPEKERLKNGFLGPHQFTERIKSKQYYKNCIISGDIDFIFGGADALFEECTINCHDRGEEINGYITAPSTSQDGMGYVFDKCKIEGAAKSSFYLGRPWRSYGKAAFINCEIGDVIKPEGFDDWGDENNRKTAVFAECENTGAGADTSNRSFGIKLTKSEAEILIAQARDLCILHLK